ncbi:L-lysine 2,3-aminomutase [uncultured Desulfobacterium sp.]|uniref:L-lysine 2,3-aminomutase n=1 Tax=uncultured Desulfobacterium sp. TaxID=201089 RepID=A0A445MUY4_9BACT|nr:L-lysine 2,3-aminomutase [uncultured Desulfobacterium sp.]
MKKATSSVEDFEPPSICREYGAEIRSFENFKQENDDALPGQNTKTIKLRGIPSQPKFRVSHHSSSFMKHFFPDISRNQWNDWRWQLSNRIIRIKDLSRIIDLSEDEIQAITGYNNNFPLAVTPYYLSIVDKKDPLQPIRRTVIPVTAEKAHTIGEAEDPLGEDDDSPVPGLVHRYPDRVLLLVTGFCSTYCRYCTRSRVVGHKGADAFNIALLDGAIDYIEKNHSIRDVLLSGGDPLTLSDERLEWLLSRLRRIPHVEILRIGTKAPVVLPQRITPALTRMLRHYHPLLISIHFTHPDELTPEVAQACERLADAGIPLGSQTVLLNGINNDVDVMRRLVHGLLRIRVRPYYLYQCDPIVGSAHFRTPVKDGIKIIKGLRGHTTGYAVPTYVIDAPGGGGKVPLLPDYLAGREGDELILKNYEDRLYRYPDPIKDANVCIASEATNPGFDQLCL